MSPEVQPVKCSTCLGTGEGFTFKLPCPECGAWQPKKSVEKVTIEGKVVTESPRYNRHDRRRMHSNKSDRNRGR